MNENTTAAYDLGGPFLNFAVLCDRVLREEDGTPSLIRIVDRFAISGSSEQMEPRILGVMLAVGFRVGKERGKHELEVTSVAPTGERVPVMSQLIDFNEGEDFDIRSAIVYGRVGISTPVAGTYWLELRLSGDLLTKLPVNLVYRQLSAPDPEA